MKKLSTLLSLLTIFSSLLLTTSSTGQPGGLYMPRNIAQAYLDKTRSPDGMPGPAYWQNQADYTIDVRLDPVDGLITGTEEIIYHNNSPDMIHELIIRLFPNMFKAGAPRDFAMDPDNANEGVSIERISVNGKQVDVSDRSHSIYYINHNDLVLVLGMPLMPGEQIKMEIDWHYTINKHTHMRTGAVDSTTFFVAYFFPRIAVYDDINGWNDFSYTGRTEFYNDFGDFDVSVNVPENFVVWATGTLQNPGEVLREKYHQRLQQAWISDTIIHIIDNSEYLHYVTAANDQNTWHFKASHVTDFAFAASDHYLWDASSLEVDKSTGRRVLIDAAYNPGSQDFYAVAQIARKAIAHMSFDYPAVPFPFPGETIFNGLDEMEYPMMVNDLSLSNMGDVVQLTTHEISHSYLPFYMGINESRFAWMDEGWATFITYVIQELKDDRASTSQGPGQHNDPWPDQRTDQPPGLYHGLTFAHIYENHMGNDTDIPMFSNSSLVKDPAYKINSYPKAAAFLFVLKDLMGEELFWEAYREFMDRWHGKHPTPYDFFYTLNDTGKDDLDWLINPWFFEFGDIDIAIDDVYHKGGDYEIVIGRRGNLPAPVELIIHYEDRSDETFHYSAAIWKKGATQYTVRNNSKKKITGVEIAVSVIPDADLSNNVVELN